MQAFHPFHLIWVHGEVFHEILVPWQDKSRYCGRLAVWKESIALVSYQVAQEILAPQSFDIWVLMKNDSGDHGIGSWTKHLTIGSMEASR